MKVWVAGIWRSWLFVVLPGCLTLKLDPTSMGLGGGTWGLSHSCMEMAAASNGELNQRRKGR